MVKAVLITLDGEVKEVRFPNLKALEGFARFMGLDVDENTEGDITLREVCPLYLDPEEEWDPEKLDPRDWPEDWPEEDI